MAETETIPSPNQSQTEAKRQYIPPGLKLAIKADYVQGKADLRSLATKYGVSPATVHGWSCDEGWHELRRAWMDRQDQKLTRPEPQPIPAMMPTTASTDPRVRKLEGMIEQTETAFESTDQPREMQALAMALDRLYQTWALLTGHEKPGIRKTRPAKSRSGTVPVPEPE